MTPEVLIAGDEVTITVPQRELVAARVDDSAPDAIDLAILDAPRTPLSVLERTRTSLEFVHDEGVSRVMGSLHPCDRRPPDDARGLLRFTVEGAPQLLQRGTISVPCAVAVEFWPRGEREALRCEATELSAERLRVDGLQATAGDPLAFRLRLTESGRPMKGLCVVEGEGHDEPRSVRLVGLTYHDRRRLATFAHRCAQQRRLGL